MTNDELQQQFRRCQEWQDARQWELLGVAYYQRGYQMNARYCFVQADQCAEKAEAPAITSAEVA